MYFVRDEPIQGRSACAGRASCQGPEHLHDAQRGRDGVAEVATGRRHRAHDRPVPRASYRAPRCQAADAARALVEGGEARAQVGRVAAVRGHLAQPRRSRAAPQPSDVESAIIERMKKKERKKKKEKRKKKKNGSPQEELKK